MSTSAELIRVEGLLNQLGLETAAPLAGSRTEMAAAKGTPYIEFLGDLLSAEMEMRQDRYVRTRMKTAGFPFRQKLADFDFAFQPAVDERLIRELATFTFVERHENIMMLGPPGVGKTHLAVALGMGAIRNRYGVYLTTAHAMLTDLRRAHAQGRFDARPRIYKAKDTDTGRVVLCNDGSDGCRKFISISIGRL